MGGKGRGEKRHKSVSINKRRWRKGGLRVEEERRIGFHPVPAEEDKEKFQTFEPRYSIESYQRNTVRCPFLIITFLFLAPALCYTGQLVMLLPQLTETLAFLLQTGLQLQNHDLKENGCSSVVILSVLSG